MKKRSPLYSCYEEEVKPALHKRFAYKNVMQVPKMTKIVINMGLALAVKDKQVIEFCTNDLALISGQKPVQTKARKSISNFKLREGQVIGLMVTLRGERMYEFMYRFTNIVCPRIMDFRGFKRKADGQGGYTLGLADQLVFPEIDLDKSKYTQGMNISFVTTATNDKECVALLEMLGLPLKGDTTK